MPMWTVLQRGRVEYRARQGEAFGAAHHDLGGAVVEGSSASYTPRHARLCSLPAAQLFTHHAEIHAISELPALRAIWLPAQCTCPAGTTPRDTTAGRNQSIVHAVYLTVLHAVTPMCAAKVLKTQKQQKSDPALTARRAFS